MRQVLASAVVLAAITTANTSHASTMTLLDFSGDICTTTTGACGNGSQISQDYGDIAGVVDVIWDRNRNTATADNVLHWGTGYETLSNVAYGTNNGGGLSITFLLDPGHVITLNSFDIAPYLRRVNDSVVRVFDLADPSLPLLDSGSFSVQTGVVNSFTNPGGWTSTTGLRIELGPDAWDVGISNISFTTAVIPLPASGLLLLSGLAGFGLLRRRRT